MTRVKGEDAIWLLNQLTLRAQEEIYTSYKAWVARPYDPVMAWVLCSRCDTVSLDWVAYDYDRPSCCGHPLSILPEDLQPILWACLRLDGPEAVAVVFNGPGD